MLLIQYMVTRLFRIDYLATLDEAIDNLRLIRFSEDQLSHIRTGMNASAGWCVVERVPLSGEDFRNLQMRDLK
jgi:hypothetical protein